MRTKKSITNIIVSLLYRIITIISGFVISKILLSSYGSEINGYISSSKTILGYLSLLELGLSGASVYSLYPCLATKDDKQTSIILSQTRRMYIRTGLFFLAALMVCCFTYPLVVKGTLDYYLQVILFFVLGGATIIDFFGFSKYRVLFTADQSEYILNICNIVYAVVHLALVVLTDVLNLNVIIMQSTAIIAFFVRSILLYIFYKRKYNERFSFKEKEKTNQIKQRWDVLIHEISWLVLSSLPLIIISTRFSLFDSSVYSVYYLVIGNLQNLLSIVYQSVIASFGQLYSLKKYDRFLSIYNKFEVIYMFLSSFVFAIGMALTIPFVKIYTKGVEDYNYVNLLLLISMVIRNFANTARIPTSVVVGSTGGFKETRLYAIISIIGSIVVSFGLSFISIETMLLGTTIFFLFRYLTNMIYVKRKLENFSVKHSLLVFFSSLIIMFIIGLLGYFMFGMQDNVSLLLLIKNGIVMVLCSIPVYLIFINLFDKNLLKEMHNKLLVFFTENSSKKSK